MTKIVPSLDGALNKCKGASSHHKGEHPIAETNILRMSSYDARIREGVTSFRLVYSKSRLTGIKICSVEGLLNGIQIASELACGYLCLDRRAFCPSETVAKLSTKQAEKLIW